MNVSGFVITALPAHLAAVAEQLAALPLTEVTGVDEACGRLAVVQERATVGDAIDGLLTIQRLPHVISADLVAHYHGNDRMTARPSARAAARRLDPAGAAARPAPASNTHPDPWRTT